VESTRLIRTSAIRPVSSFLADTTDQQSQALIRRSAENESGDSPLLQTELNFVLVAPLSSRGQLGSYFVETHIRQMPILLKFHITEI
jgi:hypothetical protein